MLKAAASLALAAVFSARAGDAAELLRRAAFAIGADDLTSVRYTAVPWPGRDGPVLIRDITHTPHGFLKTAWRNNAVLQGDRVLSFVEDGVRMTLYLNEQFLLERVEARSTVVEYWDYRELGTIRFPMRMRESVGGASVLEVEVTEVELNGGLDRAHSRAAGG